MTADPYAHLTRDDMIRIVVDAAPPLPDETVLKLQRLVESERRSPKRDARRPARAIEPGRAA